MGVISVFPRFFPNHVQRESGFQGRSRTGRTVVEGPVDHCSLLACLVSHSIPITESAVCSSQAAVHRRAGRLEARHDPRFLPF